MIGFFDMHTHILPGADDGAGKIEEAVALLARAYQDGTRAIVLTPHYRGKYRKNTPEQLDGLFQALCAAVVDRFPDLRLYLGQEIYYDSGAAEALAEGRALGIHNTGYAMLEFSPRSSREQIEKGVDTFLYYGYRPVIAHGERYDTLRKDRALLNYVLSRGALLQINADSILGRHGWGVKHFCHKVMQKRQASFIASDAHDLKCRPPELRECYLYTAKKYGKEYAQAVFYENAEKIIGKRKNERCL